MTLDEIFLIVKKIKAGSVRVLMLVLTVIYYI